MFKCVVGLHTFTQPSDPFCDDDRVHQTSLVQTLMRCFRCLSRFQGDVLARAFERHGNYSARWAVCNHFSELEFCAVTSTEPGTGKLKLILPPVRWLCIILCGACDSLRSWHIEDRDLAKITFIDEDGTCQVCAAHQEIYRIHLYQRRALPLRRWSFAVNFSFETEAIHLLREN